VLGYARPYVALILLALALTLVFGTARFARAYLIKPIVDDVILPHGALVTAPGAPAWLPDLEGLTGAGKQLEADPPSAPPPVRELDESERSKLRARIRSHFLAILAVAVAVIFVMPLAEFGRQYVVQYALGRMHVDMKRDLCAKLLALPLRFHQTRRRGDVYSRSVTDVGSAHDALGLVFSDIAQSALLILVGVVALFALSWQLALLALGLGPLLFAVFSGFGARIRRSARRRQEKIADLTQRLLEILDGIKVIKAFRAEAFENAAYRRQTGKLFRRSMRVVQNRLLARSLIEFLNNTIAVAVLCGGAWMVVQGRFGLSLGDLIAFGFVSNQGYRPIKNLARAWVRLTDCEPGAERFLEVMDAPLEIHDAPDAVAIGPVSRGIRVNHLSFSYGREQVLRDVCFEARAGEVVAIVGRTGAGKSTLIDLLLRFYDPDAGSVEIDGVDLRCITRDSLLHQIAVVGQEPFLFDGSIRENLRYGRPDADDEQLLAAARAAHVDEFARTLPEGYDTEVGTAGVRLSGGQRQRIAIGRALLKDPSILVLDEATSALDAQSEQRVQAAIDALLDGRRTVFLIAHRLSTLRSADRIVVLESGRVSQTGTHDQLVRSGGLYRELLDLQRERGATHPA
jgi:subfamily B ATP-binding cassette protein MsbA